MGDIICLKRVVFNPPPPRKEGLSPIYALAMRPNRAT